MDLFNFNAKDWLKSVVAKLENLFASYRLTEITRTDHPTISNPSIEVAAAQAASGPFLSLDSSNSSVGVIEESQQGEGFEDSSDEEDDNFLNNDNELVVR